MMCVRLKAQQVDQNSISVDKPVYNNQDTFYHVLKSRCDDFQLLLQNVIINSV